VAFSVIVTSYQSPQTLQQCLESIAKQVGASDEIVVADCSPVRPEIRVEGVRLIHFDLKLSVPEMRWAAVRATTGDLIAAIESRCVPSSDWLKKLAAAHAKYPEAAGIGGTVLSDPGSALDDGLYFCEYGHYAPPIVEGPCSEISGANLSYKRVALEEERDLLDRGCWETLIHMRWRSAEIPLAMTDARIRFVNGMPLADILRQRFDYGRNYAANREVPRFVYAAAAPLLPFLLTLRLAKSAGSKGLSSRFWRASAYVFLFNTAWAAGEFFGYLFGPTKDSRIY
jgi:hypothetical protein